MTVSTSSLEILLKKKPFPLHLLSNVASSISLISLLGSHVVQVSSPKLQNIFAHLLYPCPVMQIVLVLSASLRDI